MLKIFLAVVLWIVGLGVVVFTNNDDTNVESLAYSYVVGFAIACLVMLMV